MIVDGEVQVDVALNQQMLQDTFPFSKLAGKKVNIFVDIRLAQCELKNFR